MKTLSILCMSVLASASPALAQATPSPAPAQSGLVSYLIVGVVGVTVIALSIMSAKRSHQD